MFIFEHGGGGEGAFTRCGGTIPPADMDLSALANWSLIEVRNATIDVVRLTSVGTKEANAIVQPFGFGRAYLSRHGKTMEGLNGLKFAVLANASILGYPTGTKPPSWREMIERARRVASGDWMAEWRERQREARERCATPPRRCSESERRGNAARCRSGRREAQRELHKR